MRPARKTRRVPEPTVISDECVRDHMKVARAQADVGAQLRDAISDQFAVEVEGVRGEKRIDYKKIPIRNADGSLNRNGRALLEINAPALRMGQEVADKMKAHDYRPEPEREPPRTEPLDPRIARRQASERGWRPVAWKLFTFAAGEAWSPVYRTREGALKRLLVASGELVEAA